MTSLFIAMCSFAFVGAITPGPVNIMATRVSVSHGLYSASRYVLGASLAYALVVFVSGYAVQFITDSLPQLELIMQLLGSLFIGYLSYIIFTAPVAALTAKRDIENGFSAGALTQLLNPKAWLVAMSGVSMYVIGNENEYSTLLIFTLISLIICIIGVGAWALMGMALTRYLNSETQQRRFNRTMAIVLAVSASAIWL